jgi:hypothetical protein
MNEDAVQKELLIHLLPGIASPSSSPLPKGEGFYYEQNPNGKPHPKLPGFY